jgi:predicted DNA-binding protein with PD1-like motif
MNHAFDGSNYILRLAKGELVLENIIKFIKDNKIKGGSISAIGGLSWAELGFYNLTAQAYVWTRFDEPLELLSMNGNIAWKGKEPYVHLHAAVSDASQYSRGGHLNEAETNGTVEIFIHTWSGKEPLSRTHDKNTGLDLLQL